MTSPAYTSVCCLLQPPQPPSRAVLHAIAASSSSSGSNICIWAAVRQGDVQQRSCAQVAASGSQRQADNLAREEGAAKEILEAETNLQGKGGREGVGRKGKGREREGKGKGGSEEREGVRRGRERE